MSVRGSLQNLLKRLPSNAVNNDDIVSGNGETSETTNTTLTSEATAATTQNSNLISNSNSNVNIETDVHTSTAYNTETETDSILTPTIKARRDARKASGALKVAGTKRAARDFSVGGPSSKRNQGASAKQSKITGFTFRSRLMGTPGPSSQQTTNETEEHTPTTVGGRDRLPRSLDDAYNTLKKHNVAHKSKICNTHELAALFTIITQCCIDTNTEEMANVAEVIEALSIITLNLMEREREDKLVASLREATKEILESTQERLDKTAEEVVGNAKKVMSRMERTIDTCTDTLKVAANDTAAAAESTRTYAKVTAAGGPSTNPRGSKTAPAQGTPSRFWERDSKRLIIDPRAGSSLLKEGEKTEDLLKRMKEAWRKAGGKEEWEFTAGGRLEKGGYLVETSSREARAWFEVPENAANFVKEFGPAQIRSKSYRIKGFKFPLDAPIESTEFHRRLEDQNKIARGAVQEIKWMKPPERRAEGQTVGHVAITMTRANDANHLLRHGLLLGKESHQCVKSKIEPIRCLKCQEYGHMRGDCKRRISLCSTCGTQHDNTDSCPFKDNKEEHRCVPCQAKGHASWERTCPTRIKLQKELDQRHEINRLPYFPTDEPWTHRTTPFYAGRSYASTLGDVNWRVAASKPSRKPDEDIRKLLGLGHPPLGHTEPADSMTLDPPSRLNPDQWK